MRDWATKLIAILVIGLALFYGSTHRELTSNVNANQSQKDTNNVLIVGSTALQPLAEKAASLFTEKNPEISIAVQGGGSGAGLTQIQAGSVQIGNSDVYAEQKSGIDASKLVNHKVAVVGIAPVVNQDVSVDDLTLDQLKNIFTGKYTNWNQVGGSDLPIVVINRASGSGTRMVFEESVLADQVAMRAQEQDSNGTVQKIVSTTPGAISYLGFSYASADGLKKINISSVEPNAENVKTNNWPIWGYEHMYTLGEPTGATKDFIDFFMSDDVQSQVVEAMGYIRFSDMQFDKDYQGIVTPR